MNYEFDAKLGAALNVLVPVLSALVFLLILINTYIIGMQNISQKPSLRIYLNLLTIDFVTVLGGLCLVIHLKYEWSLASALFNTANWTTFYNSLFLFFSLAVVRILIVKGKIQTNGTRVAVIMIAGSWITTIFIVTAHRMASFPDYEKYPIPSAIQSILILLIGVSTLVMNFYIVFLTLRTSTLHPSRASANITAILLFSNCFLCILFPLVVSGYFLKLYFSGETCPDPDAILSWFNFFVCTGEGRHYLELVFLLVQSVGNNLIMLLQRNSRHELRVLWLSSRCPIFGTDEDYI